MLIMTQIFTLFANKISIIWQKMSKIEFICYFVYCYFDFHFVTTLSPRGYGVKMECNLFLTVSWRNDTQTDPIEMHNRTKSFFDWAQSLYLIILFAVFVSDAFPPRWLEGSTSGLRLCGRRAPTWSQTPCSTRDWRSQWLKETGLESGG